MAEDRLRIDLWLWRARFCKTRAEASARVEAGRIRRTRAGETVRIDKASRTVRIGDELAFAVGSRSWMVRVAALGTRRGPASEARDLYVAVEEFSGPGEERRH